jgi:hypothetical protein
MASLYKTNKKLNYKRDHYDSRDLKFKLHFMNYKNLPPSFSLKEIIDFDAYDQGSLGSCVANSLAASIYICMKKQHIDKLKEQGKIIPTPSPLSASFPPLPPPQEPSGKSKLIKIDGGEDEEAFLNNLVKSSDDEDDTIENRHENDQKKGVIVVEERGKEQQVVLLEKKEEEKAIMDEIKNFSVIHPSRLYIYYNGRLIDNSVEEDEGISNRIGCKSVQTYSVCTEELFPYDVKKYLEKPPDICYNQAKQYKNFKYYSLSQNLQSIRHAISSYFPIIFGMEIYESFFYHDVETTGFVPLPNTKEESYEGSHCVTMIAYDDSKKVVTCLNSWGKAHGDNGYFYLPYSYVTNKKLCNDFWAIKMFS